MVSTISPCEMGALIDGTSPLLPPKQDASSPNPEFNPYIRGEESHTIARDARASSAERTRWRPRILRPVVTVSVALVLLGIVGALEAFLRLSHVYSGWPAPSAAVQFGLTYGPVVAFVVLGMAWKSCEIEVKMLAPWTTMYQRPTPARSSILLDYVGADYASVLFQAIAHRHWTVLIAILGSAMFSVCTITATSLWRTGPKGQDILVQQTTTLGTYFNDTAVGYIVPYIGSVIYHLPPPRWIYSGYAIESFQRTTSSSDSHDVMSGAEVAAYSASLTCEPVTVVYAGHGHFTFPNGESLSMYQLQVSWRGCDHLVNVTDSSVFEPFDPDLATGTLYYGRMIDLVCGPFRAGVITVSRRRPDSRIDHIGTACSPVYTRAYPWLNVNSSDHTVLAVFGLDPSDPSERVELPGGDGLLYWIHHSNSHLAPISNDATTRDLEQNSFLGPWSDANPLVGDTGLLHLGTWINLLGRVRNVSLDDVMDPIRLGNISRDVFHDIFPYIARAAYTQPTQKNLLGSYYPRRWQLYCQDASVRLTQGALCIVVLIVIVLCSLHPATHIDGDPGSLLHAAAVLSTSAELERRLSGAGVMSGLELSRHLQTVLCRTEDRLGHSRPILRVLDKDPDIVQDETHVATTRLPGMWRPRMLSVPWRVALLSVFATFIVAVEVLLRRSEHNNGLADFRNPSTPEYYAWLYTAPTILFVFGLAVGSLDFAVRVTGRYQRLATRPRPARALSFSPVCAGELTIIPRSLSHGLFLVALMALTALLLPIAKIVIAGVCAVAYLDVREVLDVRLASHFYPVYNNGTAVGMWSLIRDPEFDFTRPTWTNDAYAVGSIALPLDDFTGRLSARLPIGYGTLEHCEAIETYISDSHPDDTRGTTTTLTFDNYPLCATAVLSGLNSSTTYFGRVWKDGGVQYEESEAPGCSKQVHFVFGATPSGDSNDDRILPVVHIACDPKLTLSSMVVTLNKTPYSHIILDIDESTENDRIDIPFEQYTEFLTGSGVLPTPFNADLDSFFAGLLIRNRTTLAENLNVDLFKSLVTSGWRDLWALHLDQHMRIPAESTISATHTYSVTRIMIVRVPARILEGLLSVILIIVTIACVLTPIESVLPKSPLSLAAQMSLLANSRLLRRVREGATLDGVLVRLGWWTDPTVDGWERYGIDIVEENEESFLLTKI